MERGVLGMNDYTLGGLMALASISAFALIVILVYGSVESSIREDCESTGYSRIGSTVLVCSVMEGRE